MKKVFRYLSFIVVAYILATTVNIKPYVDDPGIEEPSFILFQIAISDEDCAIKSLQLALPPWMHCKISASYCHSLVLKTSYSPTVIVDQPFIRFRNLRI